MDKVLRVLDSEQCASHWAREFECGDSSALNRNQLLSVLHKIQQTVNSDLGNAICRSVETTDVDEVIKEFSYLSAAEDVTSVKISQAEALVFSRRIFSRLVEEKE